MDNGISQDFWFAARNEQSRVAVINDLRGPADAPRRARYAGELAVGIQAATFDASRSSMRTGRSRTRTPVA